MNINDKSAIRDCTSCQLCGAVCNKGAISVKLNEDGFYRPVIDEKLCVDCGLCVRVCYKFDHNVKLTTEEQLKVGKLYSAWSKDDELVKSTTSGGIGDLIARELIRDGYKVVGVSYNDNLVRAEHKIAIRESETVSFRGSKYIQSYTFDAFKEIVNNCKSEKYAVFGTPCQIYALNKLSTQKGIRDNFIFIDLYCHGCPSLHIWSKYQDYIKKTYKLDHFDRVDFRSKVKGWGGFYVVVIVDGKPVFKSNPKEDCFYELFFSDQVLNDGCNKCQLRSTLEYTDIRMGDFWGKKFLSNQRGVSAISIVTQRGANLFDAIKNEISYSKADYLDFLPYQSWGKIHQPKEQARKAILESLKDKSENIFDAVAAFRKYQSRNGKIKRYVKNVLYYLPLSVTMFIKRFM